MLWNKIRNNISKGGTSLPHVICNSILTAFCGSTGTKHISGILFQSIKSILATDSGPFLCQFPIENAKKTCRRCHEPRDVLHLMECYQKFLEDEENLSIGIDALSGLLQLVMEQCFRAHVWLFGIYEILTDDAGHNYSCLFQLNFVQAEKYLISQLKLCIYYFGLQYLKSSKKLQDVLFWSCNWEGGWGDQMRI